MKASGGKTGTIRRESGPRRHSRALIRRSPDSPLRRNMQSGRRWTRHWLPSLAFAALVLGPASITKSPCFASAAKPRAWNLLPHNPWAVGSPSARNGHAAATTADGSVWLFGGALVAGVDCGPRSNGDCSAQLFKLDTQMEEWHSIDTATGLKPSARQGHGMTAVGNTLFLHGGSTTPDLSDELWSFDTTRMSWQYHPARSGTAPMPRTRHSLTSVGQNLFLFGGTAGPAGASAELWEYAIDTRAWSQHKTTPAAPAPAARMSHAMTSIGAKLLLFGGCVPSTGGLLSSDELWQYDTITRAWSFLNANISGSVPSARFGHATTAIGTRLFVFGGETASGFSDEFWHYDIIEMKWRLLSAGSPRARSNFAMTSVTSTVLLHGGDQGQTLIDDLSEYDSTREQTEWGVLATSLGCDDSTKCTDSNCVSACTSGYSPRYLGPDHRCSVGDYTCCPSSSEDTSGNLARACGAGGLQPCPTAQSSTEADGVSTRAVDGNTNRYWGGGSCTHTQTQDNPWWRLDLEKTRSVISVKIWNRADSCCSDRLQGFEVWIGDNASSYSANLRCLTGGTAPITDPHQVYVYCIGTGRYLFIALPGNDRVLTLCEVEVYGMQGERPCLLD